MNNAGLGGGEPIAESNTDVWRHVIDADIVGTYLVSRAVVPLMGEGGV